jgi:hypothetical protein
MADYSAPGGIVPGERLERYRRRQAGVFDEGDMVEWDGGEGKIEHVMYDGVLGTQGGPWAIKATRSAPAALVRLFEAGAPTRFMVGVPVDDLRMC